MRRLVEPSSLKWRVESVPEWLLVLVIVAAGFTAGWFGRMFYAGATGMPISGKCEQCGGRAFTVQDGVYRCQACGRVQTAREAFPAAK